MSEFKRQHPIAAVTRVIDVVRQNLVTLLILLFLSTTQENGYFWYILLLTIGFTLIAGVFGWWFFRYRVIDEELQINKGVIIKKNLYLSKERIQVIDITEGLLQRIFRLVQVEIKTAGSGTESATISAISRDEAEALRRELRSGKTEVLDEADVVNEYIPDEIWRLSNKDLFFAALTSGNFGLIASILGAISGQLDQFINEEAIDYIYEAAPGYSNVTVVLSLIVVIFFLSWLLSFLGVIFRYKNFTLEKAGSELIITSGLLERKHLTIPFNRIQAIRFVEGIFRQPFGYGMAYIESAGFDQNQREKSLVMAPFIKNNSFSEFLHRFAPDFHEPDYNIRPRRKSLFRYLRKPNYLLFAVIFISWFIWDYWWLLFLLIPMSALLGYLRYRDAAIGMEANHLRMRFRRLARTTAIMKRNRVQKMELSANPFQRRKLLQNFKATVASGAQGISFEIEDLNKEDALTAYKWSGSEVSSKAN